MVIKVYDYMVTTNAWHHVRTRAFKRLR